MNTRNKGKKPQKRVPLFTSPHLIQRSDELKERADRNRRRGGVQPKQIVDDSDISGILISPSKEQKSKSVKSIIPQNALGALNAETPYGLKEYQDRSILTFETGLSATNNSSKIIIDDLGTRISVEDAGMYHMIISCNIVSGGNVNFVVFPLESEIKSEHERYTIIPIVGSGTVSSSTSIIFEKNTVFEIVILSNLGNDVPFVVDGVVRFQMFKISN